MNKTKQYIEHILIDEQHMYKINKSEMAVFFCLFVCLAVPEANGNSGARVQTCAIAANQATATMPVP